jgi:predicted metalloprotease
VWKAEFDRRGIEYSSPRLAFFESQTQTGCGPASAEVGPFYCPADREIYFELGFLDVLQQKFGASGQFAQAYIAAHEFGHHLQTVLGIEPQVRQIQQRNPGRANEFSVAMELQADCFAGVWAKKADQSSSGINLTEANIKEALNAAGAVGDDRIQAKTQGRVDPEGFTHGSAAQRQQWFETGYTSADIDSCNTFQFYKLTT